MDMFALTVCLCTVTAVPLYLSYVDVHLHQWTRTYVHMYIIRMWAHINTCVHMYIIRMWAHINTCVYICTLYISMHTVCMSVRMY